MQLRGIDVSASVRFTQPNDVLDVQIDLLRGGAGEITSAFYALLFFDLMNGTVTGQDDPGNGIETGIYFIIKCADNTTYATTGKAKLDWYESTGYYYIEAKPVVSFTPTEDKRVSSVEIVYAANDVVNLTEKAVTIATSDALARSSFATSGADGNGILITAAAGAVTITGNYLVTISK